jgi:hypothetical protein
MTSKLHREAVRIDKQQEGEKKSTKDFWHFYRANQPEKPYLPSENQKMPERNEAYHAPVVWPVAA